MDSIDGAAKDGCDLFKRQMFTDRHLTSIGLFIESRKGYNIY